jgi:large subunit ribosomal protein L16
MNLFIPKQFKFKKTFRPRLESNKKIFSKLTKLDFGTFGFKAQNAGLLKTTHFETIRKVLAKFLKKTGWFFIKVFPNMTVTKKPLEVRMGKGKGNVDTWIFPIKVGTIFVEMRDVSDQKASEIFKLCQAKLPIKIKLIKK